MKRILFVLVLVCTACSTEPIKINKSVIIDITDPDAVRIPASVIKPLSEPVHEEDGILFSLKFIDEGGYNNVSSVDLPVANTGMMYDRRLRLQLLNEYSLHIDTLLIPCDTISYGRPLSNVFGSALEEMKRLASLNGGECHLFSDLFENSSYFSLQNKGHLTMLQDHDQLVAYFHSGYDFEGCNLDGVSLIIHHQPRVRDEVEFKQFYDLYKTIFESLGADVSHERQSVEQL